MASASGPISIHQLERVPEWDGDGFGQRCPDAWECRARAVGRLLEETMLCLEGAPVAIKEMSVAGVFAAGEVARIRWRRLSPTGRRSLVFQSDGRSITLKSREVSSENRIRFFAGPPCPRRP